MKKLFLILFILAGLSRIYALHFQIRAEFGGSSFFIPSSDLESDDDDDDNTVSSVKFYKTSAKGCFYGNKSQSALAAYLSDIFWFGKNRYL